VLVLLFTLPWMVFEKDMKGERETLVALWFEFKFKRNLNIVGEVHKVLA
jgi:hypothetical protein